MQPHAEQQHADACTNQSQEMATLTLRWTSSSSLWTSCTVGMPSTISAQIEPAMHQHMRYNAVIWLNRDLEAITHELTDKEMILWSLHP